MYMLHDKTYFIFDKDFGVDHFNNSIPETKMSQFKGKRSTHQPTKTINHFHPLNV